MLAKFSNEPPFPGAVTRRSGVAGLSRGKDREPWLEPDGDRNRLVRVVLTSDGISHAVLNKLSAGSRQVHYGTIAQLEAPTARRSAAIWRYPVTQRGSPSRLSIRRSE